MEENWDQAATITEAAVLDIIIIRDDDFPLELAEHLTLEQCESLIPSGPGGWRKVILMFGLEVPNHNLVF